MSRYSVIALLLAEQKRLAAVLDGLTPPESREEISYIPRYRKTLADALAFYRNLDPEVYQAAVAEGTGEREG